MPGAFDDLHYKEDFPDELRFAFLDEEPSIRFNNGTQNIRKRIVFQNK